MVVTTQALMPVHVTELATTLPTWYSSLGLAAIGLILFRAAHRVLSLRFAAETVLTTISGKLLNSVYNALRFSLSHSASSTGRRLVVQQTGRVQGQHSWHKVITGIFHAV